MKMEKFERVSEDDINKETKRQLPRREFLKFLGVGGVIMLCPDIQRAIAQGILEPESRYEHHGFFYTLEEARKIYEEEYYAEDKQLKNILVRRDGKLLGSFEGIEFPVPDEFIENTLYHLKDILEQGAAKYLFRLDAFHGHFFVSERIYKEEYHSLSKEEKVQKLVTDKSLGTLYHNSEHLRWDRDDPEIDSLYRKRNVIGWYDERPIMILPLPAGERTAANTPDWAHDVGPFLKFAAHKDGEFSIKTGGKEIRLDISFGDQSYF